MLPPRVPFMCKELKQSPQYFAIPWACFSRAHTDCIFLFADSDFMESLCKIAEGSVWNLLGNQAGRFCYEKLFSSLDDLTIEREQSFVLPEIAKFLCTVVSTCARNWMLQNFSVGCHCSCDNKLRFPCEHFVMNSDPAPVVSTFPWGQRSVELFQRCLNNW